MNVVIFAGTTEGRRLSDMLRRDHIRHHVCVATGYGADMMQKDDPYIILHEGRMDKARMRSFFEENGFTDGDFVVDATHPYAVEVSKNIASAIPAGAALLRVIRGATDEASGKDPGGTFAETTAETFKGGNYVNRYDSMDAFAQTADSLSGNILITTGSKELSKYTHAVSKATLDRTYVRVLPSAQSLGICEELGFSPQKIIAMHGPFSYDMNRAVITDCRISHLLTKDGGISGGYDEKVRAAADLGIRIHVITRPDGFTDEEGVSLGEAYRAVTGNVYHPLRTITLAGIGMGSAPVMTCAVKAAIESADALFGAKRMLGSAKGGPLRRYMTYLADDIIEIMEREVDITNPTVLFSGDTGFYSGAKDVYEKLRKWDKDADIIMLPGISSVSYLASRLFVSYDDAKIMSLHGNNGLHNFQELADAVSSTPKVFAIMSSKDDLGAVAKALKERGIDAAIFAGCDLSYENEEILKLDVDEACDLSGAGLITVLFKNRKYMSDEH